MSGAVVLLVLFAAALHAGWNALVKAGPDKLLGSALVAGGAGLLAALALPFLALPAPASWPWMLGSACCHLAYYRLLAAAYAHGDMSHAYPLMRGSAPLLVALVSAALVGEVLGARQYGAIALICAGVLAMSLWRGAGAAPPSRRATLFALLNAAVIACYTLIDGIGVRLSGAPVAYTLWLFALSACVLLVALAGRRHALRAYARAYWKTGLLGGFVSMASYGLALWAMTAAPVAVIAALRETSILFAALIARVFLRERLGVGRLCAVGLIAGGAVAMRFA
ncbi:EamA family transporter [Massilia atriviolacea]|uniref:EamA family transporter n=1 Tax=Massilia atriviolacea TaxID=2495579 RepID=A0A430HIV6_9BURK|nr:EamA family transporter [Massilia atriviolacea]RSZ57442.1 EamA family transporter [Massilia atriviolacea]